MKKSCFICFTLLVFMFCNQMSYAQNTPSDKSGWFISIAGGAQMYWGDSDTKGEFGDRITPALDVSFGKWLTPVWGLRAQYNGLSAKGRTTDLSNGYMNCPYMNEGTYGQKFNYWNAHIDVLFNLNEAICQYAGRFYEIIPYVGIGYACSYNEDKKCINTQSLSGNFGLLNKFRLSRSFDANIDLRAMLVKDAFDKEIGGRSLDAATAATIGLTYKF